MLFFCLRQHATNKALTLDTIFEKSLRSKSCFYLWGDTFLWVCISTLHQAEAWPQQLVCMWLPTEFTSGTGLAWVNWLLQATSGHAWGMAEGKELSPQPTWVREHQKCIWCAAPAVIHQHSAGFSRLLKLPRDDSPLLQSQLEFKMSLMCLWIFANRFLFSLSPF